jgi:hypothetical protein
MMHYDITVNDDCEIRLSGYQTSFEAHIFRLILSKFPSIKVETIDEAQANQQTFVHAETICQENALPEYPRVARAIGVKVARGGWYGSIVNTHQRPTHAARWAFRSQRSVGSITASSPTYKYPGMV